MKLVDFRRPTNLQEACDVLAELGPKGYALAGATSLVFMSGNEDRIGVDINRIGLSDIQKADGAFRVGALCRVSALQHYNEAGWVLNRVAVHLASQQIRNISTIGGNIARVFPWADLPVALLVLNASVVLGNAREERTISATEYFDGQPLRLMKPGELVKYVIVPAVQRGEGFGYKKARLVATGFSMVTVAAWLRLEGDRVAEVRVALGGGVPFPTRAPGLESALQGQRASENTFRTAARSGLGDLKFKEAEGMSADYIGRLAAVTAGDVLMEAWTQAKEQ